MTHQNQSYMLPFRAQGKDFTLYFIYTTHSLPTLSATAAAALLAHMSYTMAILVVLK